LVKLRAIFARIRLPIFSVKHPETFQIMSCLPVPQPSTLIGALAYCIGVSQGSGLKAFDALKRSIERGECCAARAKLTGITVSSPIILRRFRIADEYSKRMDFYKILLRGDYQEAKLFLESKLMDAFYRGYAMSFEILCAWITKDSLKINETAIRLLQRLGDTESLVTVSDAWIEETEINESSEIETPFPFPLDGAKVRQGDFIVVKMCNERRVSEQFIIPIKHKIRQTATGRVMIIEPTSVHAEFSHPITYCETGEGCIILLGDDKNDK
jgi:CRISPR-associated protein Cas5 subtype I-A